MTAKGTDRGGFTGDAPRNRRIHDETAGKHPEGAFCTRCGASYRNGRWTWETAPADSPELVCPACEAIASDYPAGVVHVAGNFLASHREEVIGLLRNLEERERATHPLKRIMAVRDEEAGFAVTLTDGKLAQRMGRALAKAYGGDLEHPPTSAEQNELVRVHWRRD